MFSRIGTLLVCLSLLASSNPAFSGISRVSRSIVSPEEVERALVHGEIPVIEVERDPEAFRTQLLTFLRETDEAMVAALAHPAIGPRLVVRLEGRELAFPMPGDTYRIIEEADWEALDEVRRGFEAVPGALAAPALLRAGILRLPDVTGTEIGADGRATCADVYTEFGRLVPLTESRRGVTLGKHVVSILIDVFKLIVAVLNSEVTTCETPLDIPLAFTQIPAIVINGIADAIQLALSFTLDELAFMMVDADRCINLKTCPQHGLTERFRPDDSPTLLGRGCDERDNNCSGGIDEIAEDRFAPEVSIDAELTSRCYEDAATAEALARLAVRAADDCVALSDSPQPYEGALDVAFSRAGCFGTLMATATDKAGNMATASAAVVIDDSPPQISLQDLGGSCQPDVESARQAFGLTTSDACTGVQSDVRVIEKECVADFEFSAVDRCGNRTTELRSVRLDEAAPEVDIARLQLPAIDGRICFDNEVTAVAEVAEATRIGDNCTERAALTFTTDAAPTGGNVCDRLVTSTATDTCGLTSSDALVARLDGVAPVVGCSVAQRVLWPADSTLRDVGFTMAVFDDCGAQDVTVEVAVTSDEPTSLDLSVQGAADLSPDARIIPDGAGGVAAILIRSERQQTQSADGRVYRIRVTGTDACGNSSYADCFVSVPKSLSNSRSELTNSGQMFDATVAN